MTQTLDSVFAETEERRTLRAAARDLGSRYGLEYFLRCCREHLPGEELLREAGKLGYIGISMPA